MQRALATGATLLAVAFIALPARAAPSADRDGDGIPDRTDRCPSAPEDLDGFQDADGCPDPDNDQDGIPDVRDRCPNDPETYNGYKDADGCPDRKVVKVVRSCPPIRTYVYFKRRSSRLEKKVIAILHAVVAVLKANPRIRRVQIEGHADDYRSAKADLRLSLRRARVVRRYLIKKGIAAKRLVVKGFGRSQKRRKSKTAAARAFNRRVGFEILKPPPKKRPTSGRPAARP